MLLPPLGASPRFSDLFNKAYETRRGLALHRMPARHLAIAMRRVDELAAGRATSGGRSMLMLASDDYLGLAADERVSSAGLGALHEACNAPRGARRLNDSSALHSELEARLARFKGTEACAIFPSGHMANLGVLSALLHEGDFVVVDKRAHASIVDGIRLTGATLRTFKHQDMDDLDRVLAAIPDGAAVLIAVDGIYAMDGDFAMLPQIVRLAQRYGAKIMLDDAHATGVAGPSGRGTADHYNMVEVDVVTGTLSKALGCVGGFVAGSHDTVDFIRANARPFTCSTRLSPPSTASLIAAVEIAEAEPHRRTHLWKVTNYLREGLKAQGYDTGVSESPIIPVILADETQMFEMLIGLDQDAIFASPVLDPASPKKAPRVRLSLNAEHSIADMDKVLESFDRHGRRLGLRHWSTAYPVGRVAA